LYYFIFFFFIVKKLAHDRVAFACCSEYMFFHRFWRKFSYYCNIFQYFTLLKHLVAVDLSCTCFVSLSFLFFLLLIIFLVRLSFIFSFFTFTGDVPIFTFFVWDG